MARAAQDPAGETRSYAQIAAAIGQPKAVRAVGTANGDNHVAVLIPCHRVIRSDGTLGGYAGGLDRKRKLLAAEGHAIRQRRNCRWSNKRLPLALASAQRAGRTGRANAYRVRSVWRAQPLWRRIVDFPLVAMLIAIGLRSCAHGGLWSPSFSRRTSTAVFAAFRLGSQSRSVMLAIYKLVIVRLGERPHDDLPALVPLRAIRLGLASAACGVRH